MKTLRRASGASLGLLLGLSIGCAGEYTPGDLLDLDVTGPPTPELTPAMVPVDLEVRALDADDGAPIVGARCAIELEGGRFHEALTDAEGVALFELPSWNGRLSATCAKGNGASWAGLRRSDVRDDRIDVLIARDLRPIDGVRIRGTITSPGPNHEGFTYGATNQIFNGTKSRVEWPKGPEYQLLIRPDEPFGLLAFSWATAWSDQPNESLQPIFAWRALSHRPIEKSATIDIELSDTAELTIAAGHLALPPAYGGLSPLRAPSMVLNVKTFPKEHFGTFILGTHTQSKLGPGDRAYYTAESFEGFYAPEDVLTRLTIAGGTYRLDTLYSTVILEGYPPMGTIDRTFLEPPILVEPLAKGPLEGALVRWAPEGVEPNALLVEDYYGHELWVRWMHGADHVVVPRLPTRGLDLENVGLEGRLLHVESGELDGFYDRVSGSHPIRFER